MRTVERLATFLAAAVVIVAAVGLWGYLAAWFAPGQILAALDQAAQTGDLYIGAILLTTLGAALLILSFSSSGQPKGIITENSLGQIRVGMGAIDSLVRKAASSIGGVREINTALSVDKLGLSVNLRLLVAVDQPLPDLTAQVQEKVSSYLQQIVGISPKQVNVLVRNIAHSAQARVR